MSSGSEYEMYAQGTLTRPDFAATLTNVSKSENLAARLHVDLRRQASAICSVGR
ncbi:hypothetical protein GLX30_09320 [Streptomyces sp. Tu 2975]|uniref:putative leader peptide n=1 Tax=Streptomyces sp. Tu 2975 TaxID=2676871 RepID=UPI00135B43B1|nr:putative leader peptide [Streptomyces sp. Tu 2975]QIP84197.1 hypothetical protein GLX30_09320 [Streptomyces sp. Tu 2975]